MEWQTIEGPFEYHIFGNEDRQSGGRLMPRQDGQEGLTVYFGVEDIDAALERVRELGGTVEADKMPVGGMGWFAPVQDTEGNRFSFWQPDENAPVMEPGAGS